MLFSANLPEIKIMNVLPNALSLQEPESEPQPVSVSSPEEADAPMLPQAEEEPPLEDEMVDHAAPIPFNQLFEVSRVPVGQTVEITVA